MKNVDIQVQGTIMTLKVDLAKEFGRSKSGKTIIIATTEGNQNTNGGTVGLNIYKK